MMTTATQRDNDEDQEQQEQQKQLYDGIIMMALSSWCHHDGIVTIMMW